VQTLLSGRGRGEPRSATAMSTVPCKVWDLIGVPFSAMHTALILGNIAKITGTAMSLGYLQALIATA